MSKIVSHARELTEIADLEKPLNAVGAACGWCDPLAQDPRQSALAHYLLDTLPSPPPTSTHPPP